MVALRSKAKLLNLCFEILLRVTVYFAKDAAPKVFSHAQDLAVDGIPIKMTSRVLGSPLRRITAHIAYTPMVPRSTKLN